VAAFGAFQAENQSTSDILYIGRILAKIRLQRSLTVLMGRPAGVRCPTQLGNPRRWGIGGG